MHYKCLVPNMFTPTWLYVKEHNVTGLKYLGKTTADPYKYQGSGVHWNRHIEKHGNNVTTTWAHLYNDPLVLTEEALFFSKVFNVVGSSEWANLMNEDGCTGGKTYERTKEHNILMSEATTGKKMPNGFGAKVSKLKKGLKKPGFGKIISEKLKGKKKPAGFGDKVSNALKDIPKSSTHKINLSESIKNIPKIKCEHCSALSSPGNHKRWHGINCKGIK